MKEYFLSLFFFDGQQKAVKKGRLFPFLRAQMVGVVFFAFYSVFGLNAFCCTVLGFVNQKDIISFCGAEVWICLCSNGSELYNLTEGLRRWLAHVPEWGWAGLAHFQSKLKTLCHPTLFLAPAARLDTSAAETFVALFFLLFLTIFSLSFLEERFLKVYFSQHS